MSPPKNVDTTTYIKQIAEPPPPGAPYALPVPGSERPNRSPVYRHWRFRDGPLLSTYDEHIQTFHDLFEDTLKRRASKKLLGWRPWNAQSQTFEPNYVWMTYAEVAERRKNLGAGIVELHKRAGATADKYGVGLWAQNRPEWQLTELALVSQSLYPISLYETLGPDASEYIINHGELVCVMSSLPHIPTLIQLAPRTPSLKFIISLDPLDAGEPAGTSKLALLSQMAANAGLQIFSMDQVEALGLQSGRPMRPPHKDDIITINYTSGTTGDPKGVVLTHANAVAGITASRSNGLVHPNDVHLSYLPLAHIYGRMTDQTVIAEGGCIGYFHGDILGLVEDLKILRPQGFMSVPRLYNRFSTSIQAATIEADGVKGALSRHIIATKKANMKLPPGQATNKHLLYDRIWTPKVLAAVGLDRARFMISGSAQLDPDVQVFLRAAFGNIFSQGFGMTETYAVGTVQSVGDFTTGNIGAPCPSCEMCIESAPDLEYNVTDKPNPRGELLVRGPIIFREYYKNEAETSKTIEPDGWFHTGDIVEVDKLGRFKIIDRKKNVLKLAQGEYVSPERIENVYMGSSNLVATAFVHGDGKESTLVAVFGVDPEHFAPWATKVLGGSRKIVKEDLEAIRAACAEPKIYKAFMKHIDDIGKSHRFNSYERVRAAHLAVEPFTIVNELLTPTLKLKRPQTARAFRGEIDRMYAEINSQPAAKAKFGADNCCIDLAFARKNNLEVLPTNKKRIVLGSSKTIDPVGEVRADWTFRGEREAHPLVFSVLKTLATTDLALGNQFLKATKTFTEHIGRISRTTSPRSRKLFRLLLLGGGTDRIRGYLDGEEVHALPDTGPEIMAVSTAMALRRSYKIDSREENRIRVQFADGSTKLARGLVRRLKWDFGPGNKPANGNLDSPGVLLRTDEDGGEPRFKRIARQPPVGVRAGVGCDFYVIDDLPVDVILSADFVLDFGIFSPKYDAWFLEGHGPANASLGMFCSLRVVKKWFKNTPRIQINRSDITPGIIPGIRLVRADSTGLANTLPDAFPPHVVMREYKRRKDIAANWPGMDQAAIDREKDYWRAWDAAKDHYWSGRHPPRQLVRAGGSPGRDRVRASSGGETSGLSILASPGQSSTPSSGALVAIPLVNVQSLPRPATGDLTEWSRMIDRVFDPSVHSTG